MTVTAGQRTLPSTLSLSLHVYSRMDPGMEPRRGGSPRLLGSSVKIGRRYILTRLARSLERVPNYKDAHSHSFVLPSYVSEPRGRPSLLNRTLQSIL